MLHYYNITIRVVFRTYDETRFSSRRIEKINENYARITGGGGVLATMGNRRKHRSRPPFTHVYVQLQRRIK